MNKYTLTYYSSQVESDYLQDQMDYLLAKHRDLSKLIIFFFSVLGIYLLAIQNFAAFTIVTIVELVIVLQFLYFRKKQSLQCSLIISLVNICMTLERFNHAFNKTQYENTDENSSFIMGLSFMVLHQVLLVDPRFWYNSIVLFLITFSYCASDYFYRGYVTQGLSPFIVSILFQLYGNYKQQKIKREKYLLKKKEENTNSIVCKVIQDPCCFLKFNRDRNLFELQDQNEGFKKLFKMEQQSSITQQLSSAKIKNQKENLLECTYNCYQQKQYNFYSEKYFCEINKEIWECQVYIDTFVQPTFVFVFTNQNTLKNRIQILEKANYVLNSLCKKIMNLYLSKIKFAYQSLLKINNSKYYITQKERQLKKLENEIQLSYIIQSNVNKTIKIKHIPIYTLMQQAKIQLFNFIVLIEYHIIPVFKQKISINHKIQGEDQFIWSQKTQFYYFIVTILKLACIKTRSTKYISFETESDKIKIQGKFQEQINEKSNLILIAAKQNLKILGPTNNIDLQENRCFTIFIYKDLRKLKD